MEKKIAKLFMTAVVITLITVAGGNLYSAPYFFTSPQKMATASQFYGDADMFIDPQYFNLVDLNKWFGVVSFQTDDFLNHSGATAMAQLGFAAQFGNIYSALYYGGDTLAIPFQNYTINKDGKRVYSADPALLNTRNSVPHNEAAVLIGVADMGFRLSYVHEYKSNKLKDVIISGVDTAKYTDEYGHINPEIAWGMAKELVPGRGIKPAVYLDLDFFRDYKRTDTSTVGDVIAHSNNNFGVGLTAKAGGFTILEKNNFEFGVDLWYILGLTFFNNEYHYQDSSSPYAIAKYKGNYNGISDPSNAGFDMAEIKGVNYHSVLPFLYTCWENERIALSAELGLNMDFGGYREAELTMLTDGTGTLQKDGADQKNSMFSFYPTLDLGLKWAIVPEKFFLNAGSSIQFFDVVTERASVDTYANDVKTGDTIKGVSNEFIGASTQLMLGFTFNPTKNLGFQAMSGVDFSTNNVNTFSNSSLSGLAVFSRIMATLKF